VSPPLRVFDVSASVPEAARGLSSDAGEHLLFADGVSLVVPGEPVLVGVGFVGERALQQRGVPEGMGDALLELRGRAHDDQARNFLKMMVALVPPNPKEFDMTISICCFLAVFGT